MIDQDLFNPSVLCTLRDQAACGKLVREDFWQQMKNYHRILKAYPSLLAGGMLSSIIIEADGIYVQLENGLLFRWNPDDLRSNPTDAVNYGSSDKDVLEFFYRFIGDYRVIFDVGANVGWYSLNFLNYVKSNNNFMLYAFEPVPTTWEILKGNLNKNGMVGRVTLENLALGNENKQIVFHVPQTTGHGGASSRKLFPAEENVSVNCRMRRLDDYIKEAAVTSLDLIKCDVEGSEIFFFQGGIEAIAHFKPLIYVEMLRKWTKVFDYHPNNTISLLASVGYGCWYLEGGRLHALGTMTEETVQTNFFFLHGERHRAFLAAINGGER